MVIHVKLLQYASKIFTYSVPDQFQDQIAPGRLVQVPLKTQIVPAVVTSIDVSGKKYPFAVKPMVCVYSFPKDLQYGSFLQKIGQLYQVDPHSFLRRIEQFLLEVDKKSEFCVPDEQVHAVENVVLTAEQVHVVQALTPSIVAQKHETFVLHGVTGSGKTEIYKKIVQAALDQQKSIIIMFPEVTLALRFEKIFAAAFQSVPVIGFHSASSVSVKKKLWQFLLANQPVIIIGVHMPVLLPIANLGLIIVDEEHDHGYQEKKHPKLHSRDRAILKSSMYGVPIVLGSATPSVQSMYNVAERGWKKLNMHARFAGKFPTVSLVSMKETKKRKNFWFTNQLLEAIQDRLDKKEQTIIFLNRRGYSFFVQCPCSFIFTCHQCSVSLTLHASQNLVCHYCGHHEQLPRQCSSCQGFSDEFLKKGIGTQQVVALLQKLFPSAHIERADMDSTSKKRTWANTVASMQAGLIDILVGTQSITKGYHFPGVTLVGVLWADLNLHFPMYNAAEVCLQQLIQVAGRAGRQSDESQVIIQAFDTHPIFQFLNEVEYQKFYDYEIAKRIEVGYPPYRHIAEIELKGNDELLVASEAKEVVTFFKEQAEIKKLEVDILGPIQSMVHKIKSVYSQKLYFKAASRSQMMQLFAQLPQDELRSSIYFTIDPVG